MIEKAKELKSLQVSYAYWQDKFYGIVVYEVEGFKIEKKTEYYENIDDAVSAVKRLNIEVLRQLEKLRSKS